ncbi:DUF2851 family protein [Pedobacter sp. SD-b]|uniref:DUF2851 family protein n=1 Tax=Pedobacter segetis TaxID=2793069 RepID=A0ABS1BHZ0_9SPHI|nr:DUF2851 family protein [Pedobacter segetis]MBK0382501.1 DUF2851 family protein [Pedobacter segetis]
MPSSEAILHFIWNYKMFNPLGLRTTNGEVLQIISTGIHNKDAGPDFHQSKIKIGETIWAGNIEIHLKSSDWLKHHHDVDKAYDNVILHVVWEYDVDIKRTDGTIIPVLELKDIIDKKIIDNYDLLRQNNYWIPCENQLPSVDNFTKQQALDRMMMERLEDKANIIKEIYQFNKGNWENTFYITLAKSFGFKVNNLPLEILAKQLPQNILAKHKNSFLQIEALIFGVSGLLDKYFIDDYPNKLKVEYGFLQKKYQLNNLEPSLWKFSKTRPDNFATIRLAQFAALVFKSSHLFSKIIEIKDRANYFQLFEDLQVSTYWKNHYLFDKLVDDKSVNVGKSSIQNILINAIVPLLFFYGKQVGNKQFIDRALDILENIPPENNVIIKGLKERGLLLSNSFDSQAAIHLKKNYCDQKKCLNCGIGLKILSA